MYVFYTRYYKIGKETTDGEKIFAVYGWQDLYLENKRDLYNLQMNSAVKLPRRIHR